LGEGGFGSVYKGKFQSGPEIVIKMLKKSKADVEEFWICIQRKTSKWARIAIKMLKKIKS